MYFHYKIFIHEKCFQNENYIFQKSLSRPSIIDAKAHYWAVPAVEKPCSRPQRHKR
jgi:hypothetical protein